MPFLLAVPYGGNMLSIEFLNHCSISTYDLMLYAEKHCSDLYSVMKNEVTHYADTNISRIMIDLNQPTNQFKCRNNLLLSQCGISVPEYVHEILLNKYYHPYHRHIRNNINKNVKVGVDCHTLISRARGKGRDYVQYDADILIQSESTEQCKRIAQSLKLALGAHFTGRVLVRSQWQKEFISVAHPQIPWLKLEIGISSHQNLDKIKLQLYQGLRDWGIILGDPEI